MSEDRLYEDNGVYYVINTLPQYPVSESKDYSYNLYTNSYYYWNGECDNYGRLSRGHMMELFAEAQHSTGVQKTLMILCIVNFVGIVAIEIMAIISTVNKTDMSHYNNSQNRNCEVYTFAFKIFFKLLMLWYFYR